MKLDLSKFKKVDSSPTHTTLKHIDGHELHIKHSSLSPKMRGQLADLPTAMADGGEVDEAQKAPAAPEAPQAPQPPVTINVNSAPQIPEAFSNPAPGAMAAAKSAQDAPITQLSPEQVAEANKSNLPYGVTPESLASPAAAPADVAAQPPQGAPATSPAPTQGMTPASADASQANYLLKGIGEQESGIKQAAGAAAIQAQAEKLALAKSSQEQEAAQASYQKHVSELDQQRATVTQAIEDHKIDPSHFVDSMDNWGKVRTAIGLFLGGLGQGFIGGDNPALQMLQANINRDIEAQRANLGKKENLLSANMRQYGNLRDAQDMTRVMLNDRVSTEVKKAAANAAGPMAQAQATQLLGKLHTDNAGLVQQIGMRQALTNAGPGSLSQQDPAKFIKFVVPEHQQTAAYKELGEAQEVSKAKQNVLSAFNEIAKINTPGNRTLNPIQSRSQINAIKDPIVAGLSKDTAGRFTEQDAKMLDSIFPSVTDNEASIARKRQQLDVLLSKKMQYPTLAGNYLDVDKFQSTTGDQAAKLSPQQQEWVKWARGPGANTPKAALLLKKLGLQ